MHHLPRHPVSLYFLGAAAVFGVALVAVAAISGRTGGASAAAALANRIPIVMIAADSASGPSTTPTATTSPAPTSTPGGSNQTVSLAAGDGFLFDPPAITRENPDLRWTGQSLVPGQSMGMLRFPGTFFGMDELPPPPTSGYLPTTFHPEVGDAFVIQLTAGVGGSYGEILVTKVSAGTLTFAWRYLPSYCGGSTAEITRIDRVHQEVWFDAHGELAGWYILTASGSRFDFPGGIVFDGLVIAFGKHAPFNDNFRQLFWSEQQVLSLTSLDDVFLYDCKGKLVQHRVDTGNP